MLIRIELTQVQRSLFRMRVPLGDEVLAATDQPLQLAEGLVVLGRDRSGSQCGPRDHQRVGRVGSVCRLAS